MSIQTTAVSMQQLPFRLAGATGAALALTLAFTPAPVRAQASINGPAPGVICDQTGGVCYDRQGPSIGLTQTYLGSIAAGRLTDSLRNQPPTTEFRLSNGAVCDTRAGACWSDGWPKTQLATSLTQQLFGALPAGQSGLQGLQSPQRGVVCDPAGQVCYDQAGLSLGLTREYYGALAEQTVLRNLGGQAPPKQFRLSEGSACDVQARTCWSDGWSRQRVNVALSNQLFSAGGGLPTGGGRPQPGGMTQASRPAQCRVTRWFKVLYNGTCTIEESGGNRGRNLNVQLPDGLYAISRQRGGTYQLTDPQGKIWPLQVRDQGTSLSMIWSDRVLSVTPQNKPASGMSLGQLINSLLGQ
jgi:hypothetical protein